MPGKEVQEGGSERMQEEPQEKNSRKGGSERIAKKNEMKERT